MSSGPGFCDAECSCRGRSAGQADEMAGCGRCAVVVDAHGPGGVTVAVRIEWPGRALGPRPVSGPPPVSVTEGRLGENLRRLVAEVAVIVSSSGRATGSDSSPATYRRMLPGELPSGGPPDGIPDPLTVVDSADLLARMRDLRLWAGQPSLRRLTLLAGPTRSLNGDSIASLPPSTTSSVLAGKRLPQPPRAEFVQAFVGACLRARNVPDQLAASQLALWMKAWRQVAVCAVRD
jgi:hypothetical protein